MADLHRRFQEAQGAHGVLHLLCRHGDRRLLGAGRRLQRVALGAEGGAGGAAGFGGPPSCVAQLPGDEGEEAQQSQAADHKQGEQEAKSGVWRPAAGTRNRRRPNTEEQMVREDRDRGTGWWDASLPTDQFTTTRKTPP